MDSTILNITPCSQSQGFDVRGAPLQGNMSGDHQVCKTQSCADAKGQMMLVVSMGPKRRLNGACSGDHLPYHRSGVLKPHILKALS